MEGVVAQVPLPDEFPHEFGEPFGGDAAVCPLVEGREEFIREECASSMEELEQQGSFCAGRFARLGRQREGCGVAEVKAYPTVSARDRAVAAPPHLAAREQFVKECGLSLIHI